MHGVSYHGPSGPSDRSRSGWRWAGPVIVATMLLLAAGLLGLELWERPPIWLRGVREIVVGGLHWVKAHWLTSGALIVVVAVLAAAIASLQTRERRQDEHTRESLRQRAQRLTATLQDAMTALATTSEELQREVDRGRELVAKLEQDAQTYEELVRVRREQAEAVAVLLRSEIKAEGRRSFWLQFGVNLGFFLAGVVITLLFQ
jgi:hypothetical protein